MYKVSFLDRGWKVSAVHGDKGQADRTKAVNSFKDGSRPLLVSTRVSVCKQSDKV